MAVYMAALQPGTRFSRCASTGGHLTHGLKVNFSGRSTRSRVRRVARDDDGRLRRGAAAGQGAEPKLIVCGGSAYRAPSRRQIREIADEVGALLLCDMAHFAGLVAPASTRIVEHCDFVTSTTHKTLAAAAGHPLREEHAVAVDRASSRGCRRSARAHDRGEGHVLQDRDVRRVPRVPAADPCKCGHARRDAPGGGLELVTGARHASDAGRPA